MSLLYWNNICLIGRYEEAQLTSIIARERLNWRVEYFGLGRPETLLAHTRRVDSLECDAFVTTDTDVVEDITYREKLSPFDLYGAFITIPLVMTYNVDTLGGLPPPRAFRDLLQSEYRGSYGFGGPHNSAGRSLVKSLWSAYGKEAAATCVAHARIYTMPAAAFQAVSTGEIAIAIVPTLFSLRAGLGGLHTVWPADGAIPIPAYIAIRRQLAASDRTALLEHLLGYAFQSDLVQKAAVCAGHPEIAPPAIPCIPTADRTFMTPSSAFLEALDHRQVHALLQPDTLPPKRMA